MKTYWHGDPIIAHVIATLPDSMTERRRLLEASIRLLPANHPLRPRVGEMLSNIIQQQLAQRELPFLFNDRL